jgi:type I restriction enzyme M protein
MLDDITKKRINTLRQILVGKLPDPKAQVEQITNGLIYKFMNDMDEQSVSMGGKSTYFSGKFQKYSWKNLLDTKTSGVEKIKLYSEAIEQMYTNENLPELFREIFKNSFLPFKDPSTLNMFLKEINEFHYSNSEKLGDAFEYLLSFMGSQGDAGQFRTPRHIIDFIIEIVNPQKNETVLDPACGTAGFLISAYKHILKQNTKKNLGDGLSASDRKKIGDNLNGYDISPDMVKMSLVNMYLHKFTNPKINEYDTLSSEDRWNEYYDVILANPPFFSPKGGIMPHNRFGVSSTKAEVLFIDYINEHLKPNGRAGIIVPEGIIFQAGTAYKQLRKRLIETSLIGIISLPAGVFHPYSGVKTSILVLDKKISKENINVFFQKVNNDGFSLTAQRKPINQNDLPAIIDNFKNIKNIKTYIQRKKLLNSSDYSFVYERYFENEANKNSNNLISFGSHFNILNGSTPSKMDEKYWKDGNIPWFTIDDIRKQGQLIKNTFNYVTKKGLDETSLKLIPKFSTLLCCTASVGEVAFNEIELTTNQQFNAIVVKEEFKDQINPKFVFWISTLLKDELIRVSGSTSFNYLSVTNLKKIKIPLPSINFQNEVVEELDGFQRIIEGCKEIVKNFVPSFDIDEKWDFIELRELCKNFQNGANFSSEQVGSGVKVIGIKKLFNKFGLIDEDNLERINIPKKEIDRKKVLDGDILFVRSSVKYEGVGFPCIAKKYDEDVVFAGFIIKATPDQQKILPTYLCSLLRTAKYRRITISKGNRGTITNISQDSIKSIKIPVPKISIQKEIVKEILNEYETIKKNYLLIKKYENKRDKLIKSIWFK